MASTARSTISLRKSLVGQARSNRRMASHANTKKEGDISSVFASLSSGSKPLPPRFKNIKRKLIDGHEKELEQSWRRLLKRLAKENEIIAQKGSSVIPQLGFHDLRSAAQEFEEAVKLRGVAIIKGVVPRDEARAYKSEVEEYVRANPLTKAFPPQAPAVFELYWSAAQVKARSHPNMIEAQKYLMSMWHSKNPQAMISTTQPVTYADRVRIRQPGDSGFALGPHVDGGSVERWEPEGYGKGHVYDKVFAGQWEEFDPWESSCRLPAVSDLYSGPGGCSMFRMFQAWLSMSETGPHQGTLLVNPLLQLSTAYFLLRPFFAPLKRRSAEKSDTADLEFLHEDNWVLEPESSSLIQGAGLGVGQEMNDDLHPHLNLSKTMVHVPQIQPGDFVVWHCDTIHAVDRIHAGTSDSSVLYIPVCPLTETNAQYLSRQRDTFLSGHPGPDFPGGKGESEHKERPSLQYLQENLSQDGLKAMGFSRFEASPGTSGGDMMARRANEVLQHV